MPLADAPPVAQDGKRASTVPRLKPLHWGVKGRVSQHREGAQMLPACDSDVATPLGWTHCRDSRTGHLRATELFPNCFPESRGLGLHPQKYEDCHCVNSSLGHWQL